MLKLGIFTVFVSSIIEVAKGVSVKGLWGIVKDLWSTIVHNKPICKDTIITMNFLIALICCWAFDYGVIKNVINLLQIKATPHGQLAGWIDYIGTASLIYTGADAFFKKFASMRDSWTAASKGEAK